MSYGVRYRLEIKNRSDNYYQIDICKKDYEGGYKSLVGGGDPIKIQYDSFEEDIFSKPIRGSQAIIQYINDGSLPLTSFYSNNDDEYLINIYFKKVGQVLKRLIWTGFLVQDDCLEEYGAEVNHIVTINAKDGLGLLSNVTFDVAADNYDTPITLGHALEIDIVKACLKQTGQDLPLRAFMNIFENTTDDRTTNPLADALSQSALDTRTFINTDDSYISCYEVITNILTPFKAHIFQADGVWTIVRWAEFKENKNQVGTLYTDSVSLGITNDPVLNIGKDETLHPVNADQLRRVQRPYKFIKETFNYSNPSQLIANGKFKKLSGKFNEYTDALYKYEEYQIAENWTEHGSINAYWRVITDKYTQKEVERFMVIPDPPTFFDTRYVSCLRFPVNQFDRWELSLDWRFSSNTNFSGEFRMAVLLYTHEPLQSEPFLSWVNYSDDNYLWVTQSDGHGYLYIREFDGDYNPGEWETLTLGLSQNTFNGYFPLDGEVEIRFYQNVINGSTKRDTYIKNLNLTIYNYINNSTRVTGHTHLNTQPDTIKNKIEVDLSIDDSPKYNISGTLFTNLVTDSIYKTRTANWHRFNKSESLRLGELNTLDHLYLKRKPRNIIEGTFKGLTYTTLGGTQHVSMLNVFRFLESTPIYLIGSHLEFDLMNDTISGSLSEIYEEGETDADLTSNYEFNYIYDYS